MFAASAARRIRTCNQGIQGPLRFRKAWTISSSAVDRELHANEQGAIVTRRPGARGRGLSLGLTPLVSEPSWPPKPGQTWLRIALPKIMKIKGLGSPQFTRFAVEGSPPVPPFFQFDESPALPLS